MLNENQARQIYMEEFPERYQIPKGTAKMEILISQAYRYVDGKLVKAWVFSDEEKYLNPIYIDMLTGKLI